MSRLTLNERLDANQRWILTDAEGHESKVLALHGQWAVTDYGVECLETDYAIEKVRVWDADWFSHMRDKMWVNIRDFQAAMVDARDRWPSDQRGQGRV